ncbi:glycine rich domain-containing protein, partial [Candidatus Saccharibacteria bacterium]|nr:glycine rich domain-containing protein [Candidatus Saccharibacteria bacterium]
GGGACDNGQAGSGGGGSGWIWTAATAGNAPTGWLLGAQYYLSSAETKAGDVSFSSPNGAPETGHVGDGYARIKALSGP